MKPAPATHWRPFTCTRTTRSARLGGWRATALVVALGTAALSALSSSPVGAQEEPKVTICHRTNSNSNPYVQIEVAQSAVDGVSNGDHFLEHVGSAVE